MVNKGIFVEITQQWQQRARFQSGAWISKVFIWRRGISWAILCFLDFFMCL